MPMPRDRFDLLHWLLLALLAAGLLVLLLGQGPQTGTAASKGERALERELQNQARATLLQRLYGPVEELRQQGKTENALLKLDELERAYPGEAHGLMLKGEILAGMGALEEAAASFAAGVRLNGDYIDEKFPLSRRDAVSRLVTTGLPVIIEGTRRNPDSRALGLALKNLRYLQSRLAGGCE